METNDKELLEKAAKAFGEKMEWDDNGRYLLRPAPWRNFVNYEPWSPLTDDDDALRLAVKLKIFESPNFFRDRDLIALDLGIDALQATRYAITRAAAAMVKE